MYKNIVLFIVGLCLISFGSTALSQESQYKEIDFSIVGNGYTPLILDVLDTPYSYNQRIKAKKILQRKLTVNYRQSGEPVYVHHCRQSNEGCEARINVLVDIIFRESRNNQIDPWLMLSVALYRSNFNPFDIKSTGPGGIMGLNSNRHTTLHFFSDERFRNDCTVEMDACQEQIIIVAIRKFKSDIKICAQNVNDALQHYVTNSCNGNSRFAKETLKLRKILLNEAKQFEDVEWCDPPRPICDESTLSDPLNGLDLDI